MSNPIYHGVPKDLAGDADKFSRFYGIARLARGVSHVEAQFWAAHHAGGFPAGALRMPPGQLYTPEKRASDMATAEHTAEVLRERGLRGPGGGLSQ